MSKLSWIILVFISIILGFIFVTKSWVISSFYDGVFMTLCIYNALEAKDK
jgi:hypothetical protein